MNRDGHKGVTFFIGPEVEHTPAYSKRTLFVDMFGVSLFENCAVINVFLLTVRIGICSDQILIDVLHVFAPCLHKLLIRYQVRINLEERLLSMFAPVWPDFRTCEHTFL